MIIAEWAKWIGRPDGAAHLRGMYEEGQGQLDILSAHGGAVALIDSCVASIGAKRVSDARAGDFGVVGSAKTVTRQFGVIHDGHGWLTRAPDGFKRIIAKPLAIWRL
ncbi:hypothetical protein DMY87_18055 [Rhizobium wuzhouense]|uniref:Uncharacterized protein n=1 Tax=Rhizobium wuzhouense TaxID=1986026 RepID=A0ABX5NN12_9HYPH|nr:hypothetical protein DMY87_18055 [Rhizobium wuzhouense]